MIAELMCSKVVPLPFVVWGRTLKHPHHECVLSRFEAAHPSLCTWPWLVRAPDPAGSPFSYLALTYLCAAARVTCSVLC